MPLFIAPYSYNRILYRQCGTILKTRSLTSLCALSLPLRNTNSNKAINFSSAAAIDETHENESFLTGTSSIYAEEMYNRYMNDPSSVHESWKHYFDTLSAGQPYDPSVYNRPTAAVLVSPTSTKFATTTSTLSQSTVAAASVAPSDSLGVAHLIRAYQVNGHMAAKLDPLDTYAPESYPCRPSSVTSNPEDIDFGYPDELTPAYHGFHSSDLDRVMNFRGTSSGGNKGFLEDLANSPNKVTLRVILNELRKTYTGTLGVEYMVRDFFLFNETLHYNDNYELSYPLFFIFYHSICNSILVILVR